MYRHCSYNKSSAYRGTLAPYPEQDNTQIASSYSLRPVIDDYVLWPILYSSTYVGKRKKAQELAVQSTDSKNTRLHERGSDTIETQTDMCL